MPIAALAPVLLLAAATLFAGSPGRRPGSRTRLAEMATLGALALAFAGLVQFALGGAQTYAIGGGAALLALRLDLISAIMALLVAFIGWVVVRYARTYLDGEAREGAFHGLLLATIAAVLLLVQAGSLAVLVLAFIAVGLGLRQLLLFYADPARGAACRDQVLAGLGRGRSRADRWPRCSSGRASAPPTSPRSTPPPARTASRRPVTPRSASWCSLPFSRPRRCRCTAG